MTAAIGVIGLVTSLAGSLYSGMAQQQSMDYQASIEQYKAQVATNEGIYARQAGEVQAQNQGLKDAQTMAHQKTIAGASGIDVGQGSPVSIAADAASLSTLNQLQVRNDANLKAYGFKVEAQGDQLQGNLDQMAGQNDMFSSMIGGVASVADKWTSMNQSGVFKGFNVLGGTA